MNQIFYNQLGKVKDEEIRKFVETALDNAPPRFWTDPCSSSGQWHPPEDNGEGGIIRHLIKSAAISEVLVRYYDMKDLKKELEKSNIDIVIPLSFDKLNSDVVIAASLIHDIQKNGDPWTDRTNYEHGLIAYNWLKKFQLRKPEKKQILNCIRYHMWQWVAPKTELKRALHPTINEQIVQLSDYFASRKSMSFLPGIDLQQETIDSYLRD